MKFALIIPTRNDRPLFLEQCKKLIRQQTLQPDEIIIVDYKPNISGKDITQRYKYGIEEASKLKCSFVVFWEDDDWYHKDYLKWLVSEWKVHNKPNFFGVGETYYYHLGIRKYHHMKHNGRTSAFCTLVKLPWRIPWPVDTNPFLDLHISKHDNVVTIDFPKDQILAIGIKHGIGMSGGGGHNTNFKYYTADGEVWFNNIVKDKFYYNLSDKLVNDNKRKATNNSTRTQLSRRNIKIRTIRK